SVDGTGFMPNEGLAVRWDGPSGPIVWSGTSDAQGTLSFTFSVPDVAPHAAYIKAYNTGAPTPGMHALTYFTVTGPPTPPPTVAPTTAPTAAATATSSTTSAPRATASAGRPAPRTPAPPATTGPPSPVAAQPSPSSSSIAAPAPATTDPSLA